MELTTVPTRGRGARRVRRARYPGLDPDRVYELDGFAFRTLARPPGEHLCTFATVNDVHFR